MSETGKPKRWRGVAIGFLVLAAIAVAWNLWSHRQSGSVAEAKVLIVSRQPAAAKGHHDDFIPTHLVLLRSPLIFERTILKGNLANLDMLSGNDPAAALSSMTTATPEAGANGTTNIVVVRCFGPNPGECETILKAWIDAYQEFLDLTYRNISDQTLELVTKARDVLFDDLRKADDKLLAFRDRVAILEKAVDDRIAGIEIKSLEVELHQIDVRRHLEAIEKSPDSLRVKLLAAEWASKSGFNALPQDARQPTTVVAAYTDHLKTTLDDLNAKEATLQKLLSREQDNARAAGANKLQEQNLRNEVQRIQAVYDSTIKRLREIDLARDFTGLEAKLISPVRSRPARANETPVRKE